MRRVRSSSGAAEEVLCVQVRTIAARKSLAVRMRPRDARGPSCRGRAFELDDIVLGVVNVDGRALAVGTVAGRDLADPRAVGAQVRDDRLLVERLHAQAEMVDVPALLARRGAAFPAERAVDWNEVDEGVSGAQVHKAEVIPSPLDRAAERIAVEVDHPLQLAHADDDVVDVPDPDHGARGASLSSVAPELTRRRRFS